MKNVSRRQFVKGAAVGAAAVAGAGALGACEEIVKTVTVSPEKVELEVFDPTGSIVVTQLHAPRLDTLDGKTVCEVSNEGWQTGRTFPYIRELLQQMYPTVTFIPYRVPPRNFTNWC